MHTSHICQDTHQNSLNRAHIISFRLLQGKKHTKEGSRWSLRQGMGRSRGVASVATNHAACGFICNLCVCIFFLHSFFLGAALLVLSRKGHTTSRSDTRPDPTKKMQHHTRAFTSREDHLFIRSASDVQNDRRGIQVSHSLTSPHMYRVSQATG